MGTTPRVREAREERRGRVGVGGVCLSVYLSVLRCAGRAYYFVAFFSK